MSPSTGSLLTICYRCQVLAAYAFRIRAITRRATFQTSSGLSTTAATRNDDSLGAILPPVSSPPFPLLEKRELIILEPPRPRKIELPLSEKLDHLELANISKNLLTFERETFLDVTQMEISLLRPHDTRVSKQRFKQLADQLSKQFNLLQLRAYYESPMGKDEPPPTPRLGRYAPKRDIITAVLKDRWAIKIAEEIAEREDVIVQKEIKSNKRDIFFLIGEDGKILRDWAHSCYARITVDVAECTLIIQASQVSIENIERQLESLLKKVVSEDFCIAATSRIAPFKSDYIPTIAQMTNTFIEAVDDNTLRIFGLEQTLGTINDAKRILLSSIGIELRTKGSLLYSPPMDNSTKGALYPFSQRPSLPWMSRDQNWGRWKHLVEKPSLNGIPICPPPPVAIEVIMRKGDGSHRGSLQTIPRVLSELSGSTSPQFREFGLETKYTAILGQLLYNNPTNSSTALSIGDFVRSAHSEPRILSSSFPGIPVFAKDPIGRPEFKIPPPPLDNVTSSESFMLKYLPSPWRHPENFELYPPVHITAPINTKTGDLEVPVITAVFAESNADVMLPDHPCDLRFTRSDQLTLPVTDDPSILENDRRGGGIETGEWDRYIAESQLKLLLKNQLQAAPALDIHIPPWMILPRKNNGDSCSSSINEPTNYHFSALEYHRRIQLQEKGFVFERTVIEGGLSGGRRVEIRLLYVPPTRSSQPKQQQQEARQIIDHDLPTGFIDFVNKAISYVSMVRDFLGIKKE